MRHLLVFIFIPLFRAFSRSIRTFLLAVGVLGARIIRHPERVPAMRFHPSAPDALAPSETPHRSPPRGKRGGFRRQPRSETATEPNRKTRTARRSENAVNLDELHENGAAASRQLRRKNFDFEPGKITRRKTARENFPVSATAVIFRSAGESGRVETVRRDIRIAKLSRRENPRDESKPGVCKRQKTGSGKSKRREKRRSPRRPGRAKNGVTRAKLRSISAISFSVFRFAPRPRKSAERRRPRGEPGPPSPTPARSKARQRASIFARP